MSLNRRYRTNVEVRQDGTDGRRFWVRALRYEGRPDDYNTGFKPGLFDEEMLVDMPVYLYGHDYVAFSNLLGQYVDWRNGEGDDGAEYLYLRLQLDDLSIPECHKASLQLRSGTMRRFSVGFEDYDSEPWEAFPGATLYTRGRLIEVSSVINPATENTGVVGEGRAREQAQEQERRVLVQVRATAGARRSLIRADIDPSKLTVAKLIEIAEHVERFNLSREEARVLLGNELALQAPPAEDPSVEPAEPAAPAPADQPAATPAPPTGPEPSTPAPEPVPVAATPPAAEGQAPAEPAPPADPSPSTPPADPAPAPSAELPADLEAQLAGALDLALGPGRSRP